MADLVRDKIFYICKFNASKDKNFTFLRQYDAYYYAYLGENYIFWDII